MAPMFLKQTIELAGPADAHAIALLSREFVEHRLGWRFTPHRILQLIRTADVNVAVARAAGPLRGFGIMEYEDDEAHLLLLCVAPEFQRKGIGTELIRWLEATALTAGIGCIRLEARANNAAARAFYHRLGYREIKNVPAMYAPHEDGVRIAKDLWLEPSR